MPSVPRGVASFGVSLLLAGCGSNALSRTDDTAGMGGEPTTTTPVAALPSAVALVSLYEPPAKWSATALAFDPLRAGELWVTLRQFPSNEPCSETAQSGCTALEGKIALVQQATSPTPQLTLKEDGNAWHFMRRPTAIAFGQNGNLATCGEARTDNYEDESVDYSGPTLWSSDPKIFGVEPQKGQNGTHIDMLHESPFCMGVAYERDNVYWVFNGALGALDHYDFHAPHVVGGDDHSDGELHRYVEGQLQRVPETPSHLALDSARGELYVADTGHGRVVRLLTKSGTPGADVLALDPIRVHMAMNDAQLEEVVAPGTLSLPSGIAFNADQLIVTDSATSLIWYFERDGTPMGSIDTGLPAGSLAGIAVGPDGALYVSDQRLGAAYRVEPR